MRTLLLSLTLACTAFALPTVVQVGPVCETGNTSVSVIPSSGTCTFGSSVTSGNVIVAFIGIRLSAATAISSLSTLKTSGYTAKSTSITIGGSSAGAAWYCGVITSSGTESVTVTMNGTLFFGHLILAEISGTNGCTLDGTAAGTSAAAASGSTNYNAGSVTTSLANSIFLNGAFINSGSSDMVMTATYTTILLNHGAGTYREGGAQYKVVAAGSYDPTITDVTLSSYGVVSMALAAASGAVTPTRHRVTQGGN